MVQEMHYGPKKTHINKKNSFQFKKIFLSQQTPLLFFPLFSFPLIFPHIIQLYSMDFNIFILFYLFFLIFKISSSKSFIWMWVGADVREFVERS